MLFRLSILPFLPTRDTEIWQGDLLPRRGRGGRMLAAGCEDAGEERGTCARDLDAAGGGGGLFFEGEGHGRRGGDDGGPLEGGGGGAGFGGPAGGPDITT